MAVQRTAMALDLKDDQNLIATYEKYHQFDGNWTEIPLGIKDSGVIDMQIYRIGTRLFMIVDYDEKANLKEIFEKMSTMPNQTEWAELMATFQKKLPEAQSGEHWAAMKPVFLLNEHTLNEK